jgi:hypothetical protein
MRRRLFSQATATALALGLLALGGASCGRPDSLVLVNVTGLDPTVRELLVTMTLDGTMAKNGQLTAEDPSATSFTVYKDMQHFGIDVPTGTKRLGVKIDGLNVARVVVRTGNGELELAQRKDLDVALHAP